MKYRLLLAFFIAGLVSCQSTVEDITETYDNGQAKTIKYYKGEKVETNLVKEVQNYPDGKPAYLKTFKKNKPDGEWMFWFSNGNIWSKGTYKNGLRVDESLVYHENGQLFFKGVYIEGKKDGIWSFYDEDGTLVKESEFKMGEPADEESNTIKTKNENPSQK